MLQNKPLSPVAQVQHWCGGAVAHTRLIILVTATSAVCQCYPRNTFIVKLRISSNPGSWQSWHAACGRRWSLPGVWGFAAYITATNYLQAQKIVKPQVVTSAIVLALHAPINLLLIYTFGKPPSLHMACIGFFMTGARAARSGCIITRCSACRQACDRVAGVVVKKAIMSILSTLLSCISAIETGLLTVCIRILDVILRCPRTCSKDIAVWLGGAH